MICPTRPNPAMMTCPRSSSVCPSVACSVCSGVDQSNALDPCVETGHEEHSSLLQQKIVPR